MTVLGSDDRWRLGSRLGELASAGDDGAFERSLIDAARPALEQLLDETGESVQIYRPDGFSRICIAVAEPTSGLRDTVPLGIRQINAVLRDRHHIAPGALDDFHIRDLTEVSETFAATSRVMTNLLLVVALISLVVGGVGIMTLCWYL